MKTDNRAIIKRRISNPTSASKLFQRHLSCNITLTTYQSYHKYQLALRLRV